MLPLQKLYHYPHKQHFINIKLIWRNKKDNQIQVGEVGVLKISIIYDSAEE